jgi:hypothetical protein
MGWAKKKPQHLPQIGADERGKSKDNNQLTADNSWSSKAF